MDISYNTKEKAVGAFVLMMAFLLAGSIILLGRGKGWFVSYVTYYTTFPETYNLQEGAPVTLYRAEIGRVKKITIYKDKVRVKLAIEKPYASRIRKDTVAVVESPTLIGSEYLAIIPGKPDSPPLEENGEIKSMPKRSISDIVREYKIEDAAKKLVKAIADISETASILRDPDGPLFSALNDFRVITSNLAMITSDIKAGRGTVGALLKSDEIIKSINKNLDKLEQILAEIESAASRTPAIMSNIDTTTRKLNELMNQISLEIKKVETIIDNIEKGSRDIPEITRTTRRGIEEIRRGVERIDIVFKTLQKTISIPRIIPKWKSKPEQDPGIR